MQHVPGSIAAIAAFALATVACALPASAATPPSSGSTAVAAAVPAATRLVRLTFRDLGIDTPFELRGVQGIAAVALGVRGDEVVTAARVRLRLTYSPALLPELSHLRVILNGQVIAAVPLPKEQAGREIEREVQLDSQYFTDYNHLRFDLIGHYTRECEDPQHSSLWATISDRSEIELQLRPLELRNELSLLPAPFFDRRDSRRLELPVVLPPSPSRSVLKSAGIVASWFGALADYRSARFPVSFDALPHRHALVFATNAHKPAGLTLPDVAAPTLRIIDDPADPRVKLLLLMGRDENELEQTALGLTLGHPVLTGSEATFRAVAHPRRAAYDVPRWLSTERAVPFGELVERPEDLEVHGHVPLPVSVALHLPPDLLTWNRNGVPIDLRYRYTPPFERDGSSLTVSINRQLVRVLRLRADAETVTFDRLVVPLIQRPAQQESQRFLIPAFEVGSDNQMQFQFALESHREGPCREQPPDMAVAAIDPDSTIDLTGFRHYTAMPNLALFASTGYPFTRYADLAETAIVLPDPVSSRGLEELLFVLGRIGRQTGATAAAFRLVDATQARQVGDMDLLVLSGAGSNRLVAELGKDLRLIFESADRRFRPGSLAPRFTTDPLRFEQPSQAGGPAVVVRAEGSLGALIGFESPLAAGRSVVALLATDAQASLELAAALEDAAKVAAIRGDLAVVRGGEVQSFGGDAVYYVGSLPWWMRLWFHLSRHPLLLTLLALAVAITVAAWCYGWLQRRAARRLRGD